MKNRIWLISSFLIIVLFLVGVTISNRLDRINTEKTSNDAMGGNASAIDDTLNATALVWEDEPGSVTVKHKATTDEGDLVYSVSIWLSKIDENVILDISEIEYRILQEDDLVMVHYIYKEDELLYTQFVRDEEGRLEIINDKPTVVLDPGHGGFDDGHGTNDYWVEKELNLEMTMLMRELLEAEGIRVILTRDEDEYVSLFDRCQISNYVEADLFISNHLNLFNGDVNGTEIIYSLQSDKALAYSLADAISETGIDIFKVYSKRNTSFYSQDYYFVHRYNDADSYIIEYGYADSEEDTEIINEHWETMVENVSETIIDYCFGQQH